jgi:hypothetical protein
VSKSGEKSSISRYRARCQTLIPFLKPHFGRGTISACKSPRPVCMVEVIRPVSIEHLSHASFPQEILTPEAEFMHMNISRSDCAYPFWFESVSLNKEYLSWPRCLDCAYGRSRMSLVDFEYLNHEILVGRSHRSPLVLDAGYVERRRDQIIRSNSWARELCAVPCFETSDPSDQTMWTAVFIEILSS